MVTETKKAVEAEAPAVKPARDRSPPYPFITLRAATERLAAMETYFGRHPAAMDKIGLAWKMSAGSSQAQQTAAALKSYGLVEYTGTVTSRTVVASPDGRNYLRAQQDSIKAEILKRCALRPKAIAMCWARWGSDRPPDPVCLDELILKDKFTDSAARTLLRVYDETVAFAGLSGGDTIQDEGADDQAPDQGSAMNTLRTGTQPSPNWKATATLSTGAGPFVDEAYPLDTQRSFVLRRPETFTAAELEEVEAWLSLLQRKLKRLTQQ